MAKRGGQPFEDVHIVGGPHGKNTEVWVGGEKLVGITDASIHFTVNDAVVLKTTKVVNAIIDAKAKHVDAVLVRVNEIRDEGWEVVAESTADTIWEALYDCGRQLELAARKDGQGVAQAGTIVEPSGRPPGQ